MAEKVFKGKVKAKIIELRFATSGKLAGIMKKNGNLVKKGELLAFLDKKILQTELDKQLSDYEKKRAEFEIYNLKEGEPQNDIDKYFKKIKQAELNVSVKEVELAKIKLDQAELFSPVEGIVVDDSDLVPGMNITPSSSPIKILDKSSYFFEIEISQEDILFFSDLKERNIKIYGMDKTFLGTNKPVISSIDGKFKVIIPAPDSLDLLIGQEGEILQE